MAITHNYEKGLDNMVIRNQQLTCQVNFYSTTMKWIFSYTATILCKKQNIIVMQTKQWCGAEWIFSVVSHLRGKQTDEAVEYNRNITEKTIFDSR